MEGSKTEQNLKDAFAGESQANRRYLYFAAKADVDGYNDVSAVVPLLRAVVAWRKLYCHTVMPTGADELVHQVDALSADWKRLGGDDA